MPLTEKKGRANKPDSKKEKQKNRKATTMTIPTTTAKNPIKKFALEALKKITKITKTSGNTSTTEKESPATSISENLQTQVNLDNAIEWSANNWN